MNGAAFTYGGATIELNKGNVGTLTATLGQRRAGAYQQYPGPVDCCPQLDIDFRQHRKAASLGRLRPVTNTMVSPTIVGVGVATAGMGDFLNYAAGTGLAATATYTPVTGPTYISPTNTQIANVTDTGTFVTSANPYAMLVQSGATATATLGATLTVASGGVILNGGTLAGPGILAFGGTEGIIYGFNGVSTVNTMITGTNGVTIGGTGTVVFSGANNYTGTTTVMSGTLTLAGWNTSALTVNGGTLNLNAPSLAISGTVNVGGGLSSVLTQNAANAISGNAALTVSGGTATLSQANNFRGATTLNGGTLNLTGTGAITGSAVTVNASSAVLNITATKRAERVLLAEYQRRNREHYPGPGLYGEQRCSGPPAR